MILFTTFLDDLEIQYKVGGYAYNAITIMCVMFNLRYIIEDWYTMLKWLYWRYYNRLNHCFNNKSKNTNRSQTLINTAIKMAA